MAPKWKWHDGANETASHYARRLPEGRVIDGLMRGDIVHRHFWSWAMGPSASPAEIQATAAGKWFVNVLWQVEQHRELKWSDAEASARAQTVGVVAETLPTGQCYSHYTKPVVIKPCDMCLEWKIFFICICYKRNSISMSQPSLLYWHVSPWLMWLRCVDILL